VGKRERSEIMNSKTAMGKRRGFVKDLKKGQCRGGKKESSSRDTKENAGTDSM